MATAKNITIETTPCRHFDTGAVRDDATGKGRFDLLPWAAIHALAKHCERGALHYGERNVDKGINQSSLIDSGIRHLALTSRATLRHTTWSRPCGTSPGPSSKRSSGRTWSTCLSVKA